MFIRLVTVLLLSCVFIPLVNATTVYVYETKNGSRLISNHQNNSPDLTLIKSYSPRNAIIVLGPRHYDLPNRDLAPRTTQYDSAIFNLADNFKQDRALIKAIIQVESSFNPKALSPQGAQGLMQIMPAIARHYEVQDPYSISGNLKGGIALFTDLMAKYDNNIRFALAAYNAGEGAVNKYSGIPPYPETVAYVKYVMRLHKRYQNFVNTYS